MKDNKSLTNIYGPKSSSDSSFGARARFLQSWYRKSVLLQDNFGPGPDRESKTNYGNILVSGEITGSNFLNDDIFEYAKYRLRFLKSGETIKDYRLFNNMLSSQPMCFNLFFPLKRLFEHDHGKAGQILRNCFPELKIENILAVEIEYLPYPPKEYLDDLTAFDAMVIYKNSSEEMNILAIETKYVEKLGENPSSRLSPQINLVNEGIIFNELGRGEALKGFGQLGRNFLLAEKFRIYNRLDKAFAVVISPKDNDSSDKEIKDFHSLMNPEFTDRLFYTSLESMTESIRNDARGSLRKWIDDFNVRYLGFDKCELIYNEYKKI